MELDCVAQTYAWGIKGNSSLVAKVKSSINSDFVVKANESYAELWYVTNLLIYLTSSPLILISKHIYHYFDALSLHTTYQINYCYRMGTHPSGPAKLKGSDMLLSSYLSDKAASVGIVPHGYPTNDLPFLFKILSVNTALSIQVL